MSGEDLDQVKLEIERLLSARRENNELKETLSGLTSRTETSPVCQVCFVLKFGYLKKHCEKFHY